MGEKKYESKDNPGWIEAIEAENEGYYHPLNKLGLPIFSVYAK